ncbi:ketoacyl-ACP synthase III [Puniceicoccales bacterium CK1056]|uniref:Beta-ketoacyl-[acyl-carrier-protein] synthase III n=1 Tax=Oceanipulchritudo coccoides TaxID=2706888 RepID=A0A6B2LWX9_9BACT|nr:beta-ketoacyl-ACP synthase III [Oceanipulchritudo coccoides]NDV61028.1 ketoacyl-ACP synthase III [Oceanipulchritudo coccoides]
MTQLSGNSVIISGTGSYAPPRILSNDDLSKVVDTSDEWIRTRTGIRERRIASDDETTSDMAAHAAREAIKNAGLEVDDIGLIVVGTVTPDMPFPNTACFVQHKLGLGKVPAFDLEAACSGFIYSMDVARSLMLVKGTKHALVIGAEKLSSITNWEDRTTCVLFGDGAGAVVLSLVDKPNVGVLDALLGADGRETGILCVPGGGSASPYTVETIERSLHTIQMQGNQVFKIAVRVMCQSALDILEKSGLTAEDVSLVVPHQANNRIIEALSQRLNIGIDRFKVNLDRYGNTSAASIPIALDEAYRNGRIKSGDNILMVAFGGGLTWAACLVRWQ